MAARNVDRPFACARADVSSAVSPRQQSLCRGGGAYLPCRQTTASSSASERCATSSPPRSAPCALSAITPSARPAKSILGNRRQFHQLEAGRSPTSAGSP